MSQQTDFDARYWPSRPLSVRCLQYFPPVLGTDAAIDVISRPINGGLPTINVDMPTYAAIQTLSVKYTHADGTPPTRSDVAYGLAATMPIDPLIDLEGESPFATMLNRQNDNYTWVPALGQPPVRSAPGDSLPGIPAYDPLNPPAGSIKVTTNPDDLVPSSV